MDAINRPHSIVKAVAITAITLTVAAFATALGIGMRAVLWEIKLATAELNKAAAATIAANAAMEATRSTVIAAQKQAEAMIEAARLAANATIEAAQRAVEAAEKGNFGDYLTTKKATGPAILEPVNDHTVLTKSIAVLKNELSTNLDYETQRTLAPTEIEAKNEALRIANRKLGVVRDAFEANVSGTFSTLVKGVMSTKENLLDLFTSKRSSQPKQ